MPKVIAIHSYRGGTGKSNTTANLATAVAVEGCRVGVMDADIQSPGIHNICGLEPENIQKTLNSYLWGESTIEDAAYDVGAALGLRNGSVFLIPSSAEANDIARILKNGYDVKLINDGFRKLVRNLSLDYLFIDTHPGLSKETFLTIAISHVLILILRPDKQDYQGMAVTVDVARQLNVRKMLLIVNKVLPDISIEALRQKIEEAYNVPVDGVFPLSSDIVRLASEGVFYLRFPQHPLSKEYRNLARHIMGE